jgi:hypothetical protein
MSDDGNGRIVPADLDRILPGLGARPVPARTPAEMATWDREQLLEAQAEARQAQVDARVAVLLAGRSRRYAGEWPAPESEAPKLAAYAAGLAAASEPGFLWVGGVSGSGKTTAAWKVIETAVRAGWAGTAEVVKSAAVLEALAPPVDADARARWARLGLLVLDDFGKNGTSPWERGQLHWILNERHEAFRPLIITSEKKIQPMLDPADWSRLAEKMTVVNMGDTDHRGQA